MGPDQSQPSLRSPESKRTAIAGRAATIGLDWGTSNLRAFLLADDGGVLEVRQRPTGILNLPARQAPGLQDDRAGRFLTALRDIAGDWLQHHPHALVIACGMVGSAQGWAQVPYKPLPADFASLGEDSATVDIGAGRLLHLLPGLCKDQPGAPPDVMRGEETQIIGALTGLPLLRDALFVMPGTHSKWVRIDDRQIVDFATYMTGELFSVLATHSILGRLFPSAAAMLTTQDGRSTAATTAVENGVDEAHGVGEAHGEDEANGEDEAFLEGIDLASTSGPGDLSRQLFSVRSLGLVRNVPGAQLRTRLSGLLIGHEIVSGMRLAGVAGRPLVLIGDGALCERYRIALTHIGAPIARIIDNPAPAGLHRLAALIRRGT